MRTPLFLRRVALLGAGAFLLAGCGGDSAEMDATPDDIDEDAPAAVTDDELQAFRAPADSVVTEAQVTAYLKTSLLQFDLIRKESATWHAKAEEMKKREEQGGTLGQLRNLATAGSTFAHLGDVLAGSFVRSARTLGYNPAEMEWVRERMAEVGGYLLAQPMRQAAVQSAQQLREQASTLRQQIAAGASGFSEADIEQMLASADEMEAEMNQQAAGALKANAELLHRIRPAVTEPMWGTIGVASGAMGLAALGGLGDPNDAEAQKKLDEFRRIYEDALANRVSPGMEVKP